MTVSRDVPFRTSKVPTSLYLSLIPCAGALLHSET